MPTKRFLSLDLEFPMDTDGCEGPAYKVTYRRADTRSEKQKERDRQRAIERLEIYRATMADPEKRYQFEKDQQVHSTAVRMQRDPRYGHWSLRELERHVRSFIGNAAEPLILRKGSKTADEDGSGRKRRPQVSGRTRRVESNAEAGNFTRKFFDPSFISLIRNTRASRTVDDADALDGKRTMSQADLAQMVNRPVADIQNLENGTLPYDGYLKSLLIWKLGLD